MQDIIELRRDLDSDVFADRLHDEKSRDLSEMVKRSDEIFKRLEGYNSVVISKSITLIDPR